MSEAKDRLRRAFASALARVRSAEPALQVVLKFSRKPGRCAPGRAGLCRQFAWCDSTPPLSITLAPRLGRQPRARIEGVIWHELGHALLFSRGILTHSEREADAAAEAAFGVQIGYDHEDVQTTRGGVRPRPAHLG